MIRLQNYNLYIFGLLLILFAASSCSSRGSKVKEDTLTKIVDDTIAADNKVSIEQEIQARKGFLETFYNEWKDKDDDEEYSYIKKHVTSKALKVLKDNYDYDCDGECLATWLFERFPGGDEGVLQSR